MNTNNDGIADEAAVYFSREVPLINLFTAMLLLASTAAEINY